MSDKNLYGPLRLGPIRAKAEEIWGDLSRAVARQTRPGLAETNRDLALSTASLGVTAAGLWMMQPILLLSGVPLVLFVYAPSFRSAWHTIRKKQRIDGSVVDATRIATCVIMGYYLTGAINAALYALSQRIIAQSEDEFEESLGQLLGLQAEEAWAFVNGVEMLTEVEDVDRGQILMMAAGDILPAAGTVLYGEAEVDQRLANGDLLPVEKTAGDDILLGSRVISGQLAVSVGDSPSRLDLAPLRKTLRDSIQSKTLVQRLGEGSGRRAAPLTYISYFLTIPWLGVNRAASFLCTSFGANMRLLGPVANRHSIQQAIQAGILIKEIQVLEMAAVVNCLVIDGECLLDPSVQYHAAQIVQELRSRNWQQTALFGRPFAVYVLADQEREGLRAAAATLGAEEVFVEPLAIGRAAVIDNLQRSGRAVCYVGNGQEDEAVMEKALISVALGSALSAADSPAQVVFVVKSLAPLLTFFDLSNRFIEKERFSLLTPITLDMVDITTTLVLHFGLIYSTLFNYGSLLLSLRNARRPRIQPVEAPSAVKTVAIVPVAPAPQRGRQKTASRGKKSENIFGGQAWRKRGGPSWLAA